MGLAMERITAILWFVSVVGCWFLFSHTAPCAWSSVHGRLLTTTKSGAPLGKTAPSVMLHDEHAIVLIVLLTLNVEVGVSLLYLHV